MGDSDGESEGTAVTDGMELGWTDGKLDTEGLSEGAAEGIEEVDGIELG